VRRSRGCRPLPRAGGHTVAAHPPTLWRWSSDGASPSPDRKGDGTGATLRLPEYGTTAARGNDAVASAVSTPVSVHVGTTPRIEAGLRGPRPPMPPIRLARRPTPTQPSRVPPLFRSTELSTEALVHPCRQPHTQRTAMPGPTAADLTFELDGDWRPTSFLADRRQSRRRSGDRGRWGRRCHRRGRRRRCRGWRW
jgi:hypothetical protein